MGRKTGALLVSRFQKGDRHAFGQLYEAFRQRVFNVAVRILRNRSDAEDVVQMAFVRAWDKRDHLRDPDRFRGWLMRITSNLANTLYGHRARFSDEVEDTTCQAPGAHDAIEFRAIREKLYNAISVLSPRQNQVITLRVREDLSFKEIGTRLGCSDVAARVNYLYGVRNLQQQMAA